MAEAVQFKKHALPISEVASKELYRAGDNKVLEREIAFTSSGTKYVSVLYFGERGFAQFTFKSSAAVDVGIAVSPMVYDTTTYDPDDLTQDVIALKDMQLVSNISGSDVDIVNFSTKTMDTTKEYMIGTGNAPADWNGCDGFYVAITSSGAATITISATGQ